MKRLTALPVYLLISLLGWTAWAQEAPEVGGPQNRFEKEIESIVRNKRYYKKGTVELGLGGGVMPYDSLYNHYSVGGRLTWHLSDHYSWEVVDYQHYFATVTPFATNLVSGGAQIANLQTVNLNSSVGTHFVMSPFYGKIRFFGAQVVYLDIYVVVGVGMANTRTTRYAWDGGTGFTENVLGEGWDPSINYGLGFKFFLNNAFTFFVDLRNYMTHSLSYGDRALRSNFSVTGGLSIFLPNLG